MFIESCFDNGICFFIDEKGKKTKENSELGAFLNKSKNCKNITISNIKNNDLLISQEFTNLEKLVIKSCKCNINIDTDIKELMINSCEIDKIIIDKIDKSETKNIKMEDSSINILNISNYSVENISLIFCKIGFAHINKCSIQNFQFLFLNRFYETENIIHKFLFEKCVLKESTFLSCFLELVFKFCIFNPVFDLVDSNIIIEDSVCEKFLEIVNPKKRKNYGNSKVLIERSQINTINIKDQISLKELEIRLSLFENMSINTSSICKCNFLEVFTSNLKILRSDIQDFSCESLSVSKNFDIISDDQDEYRNDKNFNITLDKSNIFEMCVEDDNINEIKILNDVVFHNFIISNVFLGLFTYTSFSCLKLGIAGIVWKNNDVKKIRTSNIKLLEKINIKNTDKDSRFVIIIDSNLEEFKIFSDDLNTYDHGSFILKIDKECEKIEKFYVEGIILKFSQNFPVTIDELIFCNNMCDEIFFKNVSSIYSKISGNNSINVSFEKSNSILLNMMDNFIFVGGDRHPATLYVANSNIEIFYFTGNNFRKLNFNFNETSSPSRVFIFDKFYENYKNNDMIIKRFLAKTFKNHDTLQICTIKDEYESEELFEPFEEDEFNDALTYHEYCLENRKMYFDNYNYSYFK